MTEPEHPLVERTGVLAGDPSLARERDTALGALTLVRADPLAPLVRAHAVADAHALTHLVPADAVELATLRDTVPLRPGHVVTVLGSVLDALSAVHLAHLAHGGVAAERVLVAPDGAVVLAGCGLAWTVPPGVEGGPLPADDVAAVAGLARGLLGPRSAPPGLVLALLRAADPDPRLRPDAESLAAAVRDALPSEPLLDLLWLAAPRPDRRPRDPATGEPDLDVAPASERVEPVTPPAAATRSSARAVPRPVPRRRRSRSRNPAVLGLVAVALPALAWAALRVPALAAADVAAPVRPSLPTISAPSQTGTPSAGTTPPAVVGQPPSPQPDAGRWRRVLARLDALRHRAVVAGSRALLASAVDPADGAWSADAALVDRVRRSGSRLIGGAIVPTAVEVLAVDRDRVRLRVRDVRESYDVVADGRAEHVAARRPRTWVVTLVRGSAGWRIGDVEAAAGEPTGQ